MSEEGPQLRVLGDGSRDEPRMPRDRRLIHLRGAAAIVCFGLISACQPPPEPARPRHTALSQSSKPSQPAEPTPSKDTPTRWGDDGFLYAVVDSREAPSRRCDKAPPSCAGSNYPIWYCRRQFAPPFPDGLFTRDENLSEEGYDHLGFATSHPEARADVVSRLQACASKSDVPFRALGCLHHLALLDRELAQRVASRTPGKAATSWAQAKHVLDQPTGWLEKRLGELGFPLAQNAPAALTAHAALGLRGELFASDAETGDSPPGHPLLLHALVRDTGTAMEHACFSERQAGGLLELEACLDRRCWTVREEDEDEAPWLSDGIVVALLNRVAEQANVPTRYVNVVWPQGPGGMGLAIVRGTAPALRAAIDARMLYTLQGPLAWKE